MRFTTFQQLFVVSLSVLALQMATGCSGAADSEDGGPEQIPVTIGGDTAGGDTSEGPDRNAGSDASPDPEPVPPDTLADASDNPAEGDEAGNNNGGAGDAGGDSEIEQICANYCDKLWGSCFEQLCSNIPPNYQNREELCLNGGTLEGDRLSRPVASCERRIETGRIQKSDAREIAQSDCSAVQRSQHCGSGIPAAIESNGANCSCETPEDVGNTCTPVGDPRNGDCEGGDLTGLCLNPDMADMKGDEGFENGYCIATCGISTFSESYTAEAGHGCGPGRVCSSSVLAVSRQPGGSSYFTVPICLKKCTPGASGCERSGYVCSYAGHSDLEGADRPMALHACLPECSTDADCQPHDNFGRSDFERVCGNGVCRISCETQLGRKSCRQTGGTCMDARDADYCRLDCERGECEPTCQGDNDCEADEVCDGGTCVECATDSHCGSGQICDYQQCVECATDSDCESGEVCEEDLCVPDDTGCSYDSDCSGDDVCENGSCVDPPDTGCESNSDCSFGDVCFAGQCVECESDGDCETDEVCDGNQCVADDTPANCSMDIDCAGSAVCHNGTCVQCEFDSHCGIDEVCEQNACVPESSGSGCNYDSECPGDDRCSGGTCVDCVSDSDCDWDEVCQSNQCVTGGGSGGCDYDHDCPGDDVCDNGTCVECTSDYDCGQGQVCSVNTCEDADDGCSTDSDCPPGQTCQGGQCF